MIKVGVGGQNLKVKEKRSVSLFLKWHRLSYNDLQYDPCFYFDPCAEGLRY